MANIMFKRGQQNQLPAVAQDGVFYLTTDTNRLYVGQGETMALLNQTVQIVPAVANLPSNPTLNDFYYCTAENILAVYNGTEWKQINPDTDTNDNDIVKVSGMSFSEGTIENDKINYQLTLKQTKTDIKGVVSNEADVTATLVVDVNDVLEVLPNQAHVGLEVAAGTDSAVISTSGDGSNSNKNITIAGGTNVDVAVNNSTVTINAQDTTYSVNAATSGEQVAVNLHNEHNGSDDTIYFAAGTNLDIAVTGDVITYSHEEISTSNDEPIAVDQVLAHEDTFDVVTGVTTSNGHVTAVTTQRMQLPKDNDTKIESFENTDDKDWKVTYVDTAGTKKDIDFSSDAAALKEALESQIADGLAAANTALTYKGTISAYNDLSLKTDVEIGDVWLLNSQDGEYKAGDMFIATGDHVGGIITDNLKWTYVPSGDELNTDTLFYGAVKVDIENNKVTYGVQAQERPDGTIPSVEDNQDLTIKGGEGIVISGNAEETLISHKSYDTTTPNAITAESKTSFTAITGVTVDNGHIVQIDKQIFTPKAYELDGVSNKIALKSDGAEISAITVAGDNVWVEASVADDSMTMSHKTIHNAAQTSDQANNSSITLAPESSFKAITGVQYDKAGHITNVNYQTLTLPKDNNTTYDYFVGSSANSSAQSTAEVTNPHLILRDNAGANDNVQVKGDDGSLVVKAKENVVTISMVWGTF